MLSSWNWSVDFYISALCFLECSGLSGVLGNVHSLGLVSVVKSDLVADGAVSVLDAVEAVV